jgi:hypothetical protein
MGVQTILKKKHKMESSSPASSRKRDRDEEENTDPVDQIFDGDEAVEDPFPVEEEGPFGNSDLDESEGEDLFGDDLGRYDYLL